jgi:FixJ family two-component response regulator
MISRKAKDGAWCIRGLGAANRSAPRGFPTLAQTYVISIVDDDASLRAALTGLVRALGHEARSFESAEAFLAADPASACVVTDIHMPGLSGLDLMARLAAKGDPTPVIVITARGEAGLEDKAVAGGAFCVLKKPFAPDALIACLERALAGESRTR